MAIGLQCMLEITVRNVLGATCRTNICFAFAMNCKKLDLKCDSDQLVRCALFERKLLTLSKFDMSGLENWLPQVICIWSKALWFCLEDTEVAWLCKWYTREDG